MLKSGSAVPEGSLVYVREGSSAFLRTPAGWSRLLVPGTEDAPRGPSQGGGGQAAALAAGTGLGLALEQQSPGTEPGPP